MAAPTGDDGQAMPLVFDNAKSRMHLTNGSYKLIAPRARPCAKFNSRSEVALLPLSVI
jgi:hypothetical protein